MSYKDGFTDGWNAAMERFGPHQEDLSFDDEKRQFLGAIGPSVRAVRKKAKRKLSKWNLFVKKNSKKAKYRYKSGAKKGKLNLKKMGIDFRKSKR